MEKRTKLPIFVLEKWQNCLRTCVYGNVHRKRLFGPDILQNRPGRPHRIIRNPTLPIIDKNNSSS